MLNQRSNISLTQGRSIFLRERRRILFFPFEIQRKRGQASAHLDRGQCARSLMAHTSASFMRSAHVTASTANAEFRRFDYRTQMQSVPSDSPRPIEPYRSCRCDWRALLTAFHALMPAETSCTSCCHKLQLLFQASGAFGYTAALLHDHEARRGCNRDLQPEKTASSKMNGLTYPTLQFSAGLASLNDENSAQHSGCRTRCVLRDWPMLL